MTAIWGRKGGAIKNNSDPDDEGRCGINRESWNKWSNRQELKSVGGRKKIGKGIRIISKARGKKMLRAGKRTTSRKEQQKKREMRYSENFIRGVYEPGGVKRGSKGRR